MNTLDTLKQFVILEELAHGGMGAIYVAYNPSSRRLVAIKTLFKAASKDKVAIERFILEGEIYKKFSHPNIVGFVDMGEVDGINFIAMEHVKGKGLDAILKSSGRIPWQQAIKYIGALADAMAHYHDRALIHRDIKPQNVLISTDGVVKLIDFGIAVTTEQAANPDGSIVGTFNYSSPEQNQGRKLDERSDIYALGLMFHEMITGKRVFPQTSLAEVCTEQLRGDIPFPSAVESDLPKGLDKLVMKLLAKDPNARYQKAKELLADLELLKEDPQGFDPGSSFDDEELATKWDQAKDALSRKDFDQALRLGQVVASRKEGSAEILAFMGKAHAGAGSLDECTVAFKKAIELEPHSDQHKLDFGIALYGLSRFDDAEAQFQNILDLVPDNPYAKRYLGLCRQAKAGPPQATPAGGIATPTPPGGVKPVTSSPGNVKVIQIPSTDPAAAAPSAGKAKTAYLWWGAGAFGTGHPLRVILLSILELALLGAIALPWTPLWPGLVQGPTAPLANLFSGPLAAAADFKEWTLAGPAILLFVVLEILIPARLSKPAA